MQVDPEKLLNAFKEFRDAWKGKELVFCTHRQADIDALASAAVLSRHFEKSQVAIPGGDANSSAKALAERYGIRYVPLESLPETLPVVAVDTSSVALLPAEGRRIIAVIDHHQKGPDNFEGEFNIVDSGSKATAEIVALLLEEELSEEDAALLATAIISDTFRFITSTERTLDVFVKLYKKSGMAYEELLSLAFPDPPLEEKLAVLEGLKKHSYEVYGGRVISTTVVGMKNGVAAHMLAQAGDVAFAAQWDDERRETRVSARASPHVDVPLNKVMAEVASRFGGKGGGHMKAAGCIAKAPPQEVLEECSLIVKKYL